MAEFEEKILGAGARLTISLFLIMISMLVAMVWSRHDDDCYGEFQYLNKEGIQAVISYSYKYGVAK